MSTKVMSEQRFQWLQKYFADLPENIAPVTQECLEEISRLREQAKRREEPKQFKSSRTCVGMGKGAATVPRVDGARGGEDE